MRDPTAEKARERSRAPMNEVEYRIVTVTGPPTDPAFWRLDSKQHKTQLQPPKVDIKSFLVAHSLPKSSPLMPSHTNMAAKGFYGDGDSGKYFIFQEELDQFYQLYIDSLFPGPGQPSFVQHLSEENSFLTHRNNGYEYGTNKEKRYFKLYVDLDPKERILDDQFVTQVVMAYKKAIAQVLDLNAIPENEIQNYKVQHARRPAKERMIARMYIRYENNKDHPAMQHYVIRNSANTNKLHLYFPYIIVSKNTALHLRRIVLNMPHFQNIPEKEKNDLFDANYGGLRMLGSFKLDKKKVPWGVVPGCYLPPGRMSEETPLRVEDLHFYSIKPHPDSLPTPKRKKHLTAREKKETIKVAALRKQSPTIARDTTS